MPEFKPPKRSAWQWLMMPDLPPVEDLASEHRADVIKTYIEEREQTRRLRVSEYSKDGYQYVRAIVAVGVAVACVISAASLYECVGGPYEVRSKEIDLKMQELKGNGGGPDSGTPADAAKAD